MAFINGTTETYCDELLNNGDYNEGGLAEFYISSAVVTLLALFYLLFAGFNLFGIWMGSFGRKFIFEMDDVMGGLIGIPHFSKVEGAILVFGAVTGPLSWAVDSRTKFVTIFGLLIIDIYFLVCVAYSLNARQPHIQYWILISANTSVVIWRTIRFLCPQFYLAVLIVAVIGLVLAVLVFFMMRRRRAQVEPKIRKLIEIQRFETEMKTSDANFELNWLPDKDAPEGFEQYSLEHTSKQSFHNSNP